MVGGSDTSYLCHCTAGFVSCYWLHQNSQAETGIVAFTWCDDVRWMPLTALRVYRRMGGPHHLFAASRLTGCSAVLILQRICL